MASSARELSRLIKLRGAPASLHNRQEPRDMLTGLAAWAFPYAPAYRAQTAWGPWMAVLATLIILASVATAGRGLVEVLRNGQPISTGTALLIDFLTQIATGGLTLLAAGMFGGRPAETLALRSTPRGWRDIGAGLLAVTVITVSYTLVTTLLFPEDFVRDLRPLWAIMQSQWWWLLALIAVIGAPLSEELLFRGFLQPALTKRLGFISAAIVTTTAWTALHASYSAVGLGEVFLVGLVLSWLLWRTGSLWVPILCHGIYNAAVISFLAAFPVPA